MHFVVNFIVVFCLLCSFAYPCTATSDHERNVGTQKEQICDAAIVELVGKFLKIDSFKVPTSDNYPEDVTVVISSACKSIPTQNPITITAIAYTTEKVDVKGLVIATVDTEKGDVLSSYWGEIEEDAGMRIVPGSLWIDTAPYNLSDGIRAFGLDLTSGYISHCVEGGVGATRTLYIQEARQIRPILQDLTMSYWSFIQPGMSTCATKENASKTSIIKNITVSIGLGDTSTLGYRDLVVTALTSRDDGKKTKKSPFRYKLYYDGQKYSIQEMMVNFYKWRN
jgi:hypothetical protein